MRHGGANANTKTPTRQNPKKRSTEKRKRKTNSRGLADLLVDLAIWSTSSVEVLVQRIADALHTESNS